MCSLKPRCAETQRTTFLKIACFENHLQGIAGPGAPHVYRLDRFENAGPTGKPEETTSAKKVTKKNYSFRFHGCCMVLARFLFPLMLAPGVARSDVKSTFWEKRGARPSPCDVILRTVCSVHM